MERHCCIDFTIGGDGKPSDYMRRHGIECEGIGGRVCFTKPLEERQEFLMQLFPIRQWYTKRHVDSPLYGSILTE